jgi:hypothetical protein
LGGCGGIEGENLGLLGGVGMVTALVDLQLAEELAAERVVG